MSDSSAYIADQADKKAEEMGLAEQVPIKGTIESTNLELLGLTQQTERSLGTFQIIGGGWNICNSWAGIVGTLAIGISEGGTILLLYGIVIMLVFGGCCATTLAELSSVYPTAGGQYHWTSILSPKKYSRVLSYCCGAVNIFSWISISAGVTILPAQFIISMAIYNNPEYESKTWHYFLIYQATNIIVLLYNIFAIRRTSWIHDIGFILSLSSFSVILVTCLARTPEISSTEFVWTTFINQSGWKSDGIAFLTGMINPNYIYAGIDGAIHLAEECGNAPTAVPYALMSTLVIGFVTSFAFVVAMLYSLTDINAVIETSTGVPIYEIWLQATRSGAAATTFITLLAVIALFSLNGCQQTSSRLTWAFARDDALILSKFIGRIHPQLQVPVYALLANALVIFMIGCIYLASSTAFNALIGTGLVLQQVSFCFPVALLIFRRRSSTYLPPHRFFNMRKFGWVSNIATLIFGIVTMVFYNFPAEMPVTGGNMNYTSVVIGTMALFSMGNWVFHANKGYQGPRLPSELT
ncbi:hypothetical protein N7509_009726 [Penicillium cosmopolitanum]|uniref:Amino acid permease/ SLC12A domain-containing protein n=1 Tax=Penicillium cosmopolitanum TaxID=1131564 RepID=A0A9X0B3Y2_9EURO|nr:uncharacterized protein N7509_009726 [Penicillium cosmopolitanum]KAJ5387185.1 hypothetical protein N7509_009726 [Penicillium cosmopolitanum]